MKVHRTRIYIYIYIFCFQAWKNCLEMATLAKCPGTLAACMASCRNMACSMRWGIAIAMIGRSRPLGRGVVSVLFWASPILPNKKSGVTYIFKLFWMFCRTNLNTFTSPLFELKCVCCDFFANNTHNWLVVPHCCEWQKRSAGGPTLEDSDWVAGTMLQQVRGGSVLILHMPERGEERLGGEIWLEPMDFYAQKCDWCHFLKHINEFFWPKPMGLFAADLNSLLIQRHCCLYFLW